MWRNKLKRLKNKRAFSLLECIFSVFLLTIITVSIFYSILIFSKYQNLYSNKIEILNDIENTMFTIKNNIKNNKNILDEKKKKKYNIQITNKNDLYLIKLECKIDGELKNYEMYVTKNK